MMRTFRDTPKQFGGKVMRLDARQGANDDQPFYEIPEFANISRLGIAQ